VVRYHNGCPELKLSIFKVSPQTDDKFITAFSNTRH